MPHSMHLQKQLKSPNPGTNLFQRCCKVDAANIIYSNTPVINGGETWAHIFVGLILRITDDFKVTNGSVECFLGTLQDCVCMCGATTNLIADDSPPYCSQQVTKYLQDT